MQVDMNSLIELARLATICIAIVIGAFALVGVAAVFKAPEATTKVMLVLIQSGSLIRIGTAVVIVLVIFGLRLTDKVSAEATIATLSGIAGYLLGGQSSSRRDDSPQSS